MSVEKFDRVVSFDTLAEDDREYQEIPVAVWKANARVQTLNGKELVDVLEHGGVNIGYKLIALCLVDASGRQVFRLPDEDVLDIKNTEAIEAAVERVKLKNPKAINEIAEALIVINGITLKKADAEQKADDVKNDSGETPIDVSPIDSPSVSVM